MTTVREVMTDNVTKAKPGDSLETLAQEMEARDVGFLPIVDEDKLVGVVTDRDIVRKGLAKDFKSNGVSAEQIMTDKVITALPDMQVEEASRLMQDHQIKRLIVAEDRKIKGVVSLGDLAVSNKEQSAEDALGEIKKSSNG
ncbi:CBS domain-containing protein [Sediminibacillus halophilus]|uniref:CBS domain-containing protein n=1 Tax=Sediminibacillus halophilus TaxID=482461 RepID=A0A1G9X531_9BACI|nr:CBS domain-containing protein [Sediminibacillus halophilus]SDM91485.1 CBS domain-containing protein [Sediminibacillus halophilus]